MLNLKTRFERKARAQNVKRGFYFDSNVLPSARLNFCVTDLFQFTFIDFRFSDVYGSLMKNLARMLMHVRKI